MASRNQKSSAQGLAVGGKANKAKISRSLDSREEITWQNIRRAWPAYLLLGPIFALLIMFVYYPPILGLVRAFYNWAPLKEPVFVGLENFRAYFSYPESAREITNVLKLVLASLVTGVAAPFVMAELIFLIRNELGKKVYRLIIVIPMLVPGVVYTLLWTHIYDPNLGPVNTFLNNVGLTGLAMNWLGDPATALYSVMFVGFPWVAGIGTLVCLGGLAQVSQSVFDACLIDGCVGIRRVLSVDVPLVFSQLRLLTILSVINALTSFERVLVLTRGGPGYATSVPGLRMYERAFTTGQFGFASAIGLLLFVFAAGMTYLLNRYARSYAEK